MNTEFRQSIEDAISNANLTGALARFSEAYRVSRARAYEGIDFEALRAKIADRKGAAAGHLNELAEEFQRNAEALGAKVFRTSDPAAVRDYILNVAREQGARCIVKSKSMASEEIHLNAHLQAGGMEVFETDLGEWIIQLAGQRPSHMVMPAIHMTKEQVAELFSKEVEERLAADIPRLVKVAREELREKFLRADIGISGANIAVAETGSLVLCTNEGNARLVTTLPKTHIAVVGIEKLVEKFDDMLPILQALPRSATAQLLTSYVSIITGPVENLDGSEKELHIILMDNRRTEMAADPVFKEALQCIRCASCLNVCPVYRLVGGHVFGKVYTGGIGTILTAWFDHLKQSEEIQSLCIQCGACRDYCPGQIDIPELILELRNRIKNEEGLKPAEKAIFAIVNHRKVFHGLLRAASIAQKPFADDGMIRHLPLFLSGMTETKALPAIAAEPFRDRFAKIQQPKCVEKAAIYAGCLIDFAYPEIGEAMVKVLNAAGIEAVFPEEQSCCGAPAKYSGAVEAAKAGAEANRRAFAHADVKWIVSACPTCTVSLQQELPRQTVDFSVLARELFEAGRLKLKAAPGTVTYHDSCHQKRALHATEPPREMLREAGYEIVEMFESDVCCGMGGSYSVKMPEVSAQMLERKLTHIRATGAPDVAMDCPGCLLQIRGGLETEGAAPRVKHTAERLAERLAE
ncbi:MAG: LUD domain-containing protein [Acidobacteria bacterium]|nr:LUD domain-containing protein [Acidobacteriota bacterium]